jgi:hypothetical protein
LWRAVTNLQEKRHGDEMRIRLALVQQARRRSPWLGM